MYPKRMKSAKPADSEMKMATKISYRPLSQECNPDEDKITVRLSPTVVVSLSVTHTGTVSAVLSTGLNVFVSLVFSLIMAGHIDGLRLQNYKRGWGHRLDLRK